MNKKVMSCIVRRNLIKPFAFFIFQILTGTNVLCQVQENMIDYLTGKFENYVSAVPWEEIYLHTDRDEYIAGEYIWTNCYLFERKNLKPSKRSKIAYIELLNFENRPVVQKRFLINNGSGPGQLQLPDTLSTGNYTLRAYTNWMKNFLPNNCFVKEIKVYNALRSNKYVQKNSSGLSVSTGNEMAEKTGVSIVSLSGDPEKGGLEIVLNADDNYTLRNDNLFYLFIQTHGKIDLVKSERFVDNTARIILPENTLSPGINQITVFDSKGRPVCVNYKYTPSGEPESTKVTISSSENYSTRQRIIIDINTVKAASETPNTGNLSVSVIPRSAKTSAISLNDYLLFGTEFGPLNNGYSGIHGLSSEQIDTILQNIRSNWINWDIVLSEQIPGFKYQAETVEHFLSGNLGSDQTISPEAETVLLIMPGREPEFQFAKTDKNGDFSFRLNIDEDVKDLVIMPDDVGIKKKIILESPFSDKYLSTAIMGKTDWESFPDIIEEWNVNYQTRKIYGIAEAGNALQPKISHLRPVRFYGEPDIELILADYVSLPGMEEVFFELLPGVSLRKRNSVFEILITNRINEKTYQFSPYLFIDGVKITDAATIASLDPQEVEKIDVIRDKYAIGTYLFPGIVNVVTKSADFRSIPLPDHMIRMPYRVIDPVLSFAMPDYSSEERRMSSIPDFRNTLYWNPSLKPDKEGKVSVGFWTSDIVSDYEIVVQGINEVGEIITAREFFTVE